MLLHDLLVCLQGNVETWLSDLMKMTHASIHSVIKSAAITIDDPQFNLVGFENDFPAQVGILLIFTSIVLV